MTDEQAEAAWEEWRKDAAQPVTRHPVTAMVEAAVRLGIVVPAGARVQVPQPNDEPLRALIEKWLATHGHTPAYELARRKCADELEALLPRSVQAQPPSRKELADAISIACVGTAPWYDCADAVLALLARAAGGQDGEQQS